MRPPHEQKIDSANQRLPTMTEVFLRPDVKLEPLVCGWYAWIHLISPVQHALNIAYRHLPLMESFASNPAVHLAASSDPAMFGGPFVALAPEQVPQIRRLTEETRDRCARLIALAHDVKRLDGALQDRAKGYSLDECYAMVPESLSGLVEFVYDINNHPRLRFHEPLLYDEYFDARTQQVCLSLTKEADRAFFMTTPRLPSPDCLVLPLSFDDRRLDRLAAMRTTPAPLAAIAQDLGITETQQPLFERLFTTDAAPMGCPAPAHGAVRVRYFGHACVLIESASVSILIDPMLAWENHKSDGRYTFHDLPAHLDYVVLSHSHHDHCAPEALIQLRHRIGRVVVPANNAGSISDPSMALALRRLGFRQIDVLNAFDELAFPGGRLTSLPFLGEHCDLDIYSRHGVHIEIDGRTFAFFIDSNGMDRMLFRRIAGRVGRRLDGLFIGMECRGGPLSWLYGPLLTRPISRRNDESRRLSGLDSARAWGVLQEFDVSNVFVYAMGQEPWLRFIMGLEYTPDSIQRKEVAVFLDQCARTGIGAESLFMGRELTF